MPELRYHGDMLKKVRSILWLPEALALAGGLVFLAQLLYYAHTQVSVLDEGLYLYKGFVFASGRYTPYQNYGPLTNQMPFAFLLPGLVQVVFGPGLRVGRYFAVFLALVMVFALWLTSRRMGGRWLAAGVVWMTAINSASARMYSQAISEGTIACLVMLVLALTLGGKRPLWQLILGGVLSGVIVMIRINLLPLPFFLVLYILWQYGWKKSLGVALAGVVTVAFSHALFWPNILRLWTYWLPENLTPFLDPWRQPAGASPLYNPAVSYLSRGVSFINAFRFHFTAFFGALLAWAFWPRRTTWKSDENFRAAVFLSVLFISLITLHGWASLGKNYCVFCFPIYASFFSGVGLLLVAVSLPSWQLHQPLLQKVFGLLVVFALLVGIAFIYYEASRKYAFPETADKLMKFQVPRLGHGRILPGKAELGRLVANLTGLSYYKVFRAADFVPFLPICAAIELGLVFLLWIGGWLSRLRGQPVTTRLLLIFWLAGCVLLPTNLLPYSYRAYDCGSDEISNYEAVGEKLAQTIPAEAQIFWRGYSPVNLLYLPRAAIYPPQLNGDYSFRLGGDSDALLRYGWWNEPLGRQWAAEADYLLVEQKYYTGWLKDLLESGGYEEFARMPSNAPCRTDAALIIYRQQP
jgi:hypothetical protein